MLLQGLASWPSSRLPDRIIVNADWQAISIDWYSCCSNDGRQQIMIMECKGKESILARKEVEQFMWNAADAKSVIPVALCNINMYRYTCLRLASVLL